MLGAMGKTLKRAMTILVFLGLIALNIFSLASSAVHDLLYGTLSRIPITAMAELLTASPTEKKKKLAKKNKALQTKLTTQKTTARKIAKRIAFKTTRMAVLNVSSIAAEAMPYVGIGAILTVTALEVKLACEIMRDTDELIQTFGLDHDTSQTIKVCGTEVPKYEKLQNTVGGVIHGMIH